MEGYTESIQKSLDAALIAFGTVNGIKVCLENIGAPTNASTPYLAGYFMPAPTEDADLYFSDRRQGVYQIDINYASHLGTAPINKMADKLNLAFKPSTGLSRSGVCVEITNFSDERANIANGWATKPCSITWITYTERL